MARMEVVTCDGCGAEAPRLRGGVLHSSMFPADGWYGLTGGRGTEVGRVGGDEVAVCSPDCLLRVVQRLAGVVIPDELEVLFQAPAAAPTARPAVKRPRAPRKPEP